MSKSARSTSTVNAGSGTVDGGAGDNEGAETSTVSAPEKVAPKNYPATLTLTNSAERPFSFPDVGVFIPSGEEVIFEVKSEDQLTRLYTDIEMLIWRNSLPVGTLTIKE